MRRHIYIPPAFPGRPVPRGCRRGESIDRTWVLCNLPEGHPVHLHPCTCGPDHTGEAPLEDPRCPTHGVNAPAPDLDPDAEPPY